MFNLQKKIKTIAFTKLNTFQRCVLWMPVIVYTAFVGIQQYQSYKQLDGFSFYDHRGMVSCVLIGGDNPSWSCKNSSGMSLAEDLPATPKVWSYDNGYTTVERTVQGDGARYKIKSEGLRNDLVAHVQ